MTARTPDGLRLWSLSHQLGAISPLAVIRSQYRRLSLDDVKSLLCDLLQSGEPDLPFSDDWADAMAPLDAAFADAWPALDAVADFAMGRAAR